jgi:hypothetical protein
MASIKQFASQFKRGTVPRQPVDPGSPLNGPPVSSPSKKRNSVSLGSMSEAYPGMVGKQSFGKNRKK